MKKEIIHEELSGKIIGIAMEVLNELKPGLDERLYERAMVSSNCGGVAMLSQSKVHIRFTIAPS